MQAQAVEKQIYTPEEYLELEDAADFRSEYLDAQIIPMAGGTTNHNKLAGNFYADLNVALRKSNYEVFIGDVRLWIPQQRIYTYPDVMVVAGEAEYHNSRNDIITNPQVIIEVLSKSTRDYDCQGKFSAYQTISSFQEYLLIDQTRIYVEQFAKTGKKLWSLRQYDEEDEAIELVSVSFKIAIADLYNKVNIGEVEPTEES
ncbi:MAG: Uma2 family endonuclease [Geitlerinemataceae cyanobacterium]